MMPSTHQVRSGWLGSFGTGRRIQVVERIHVVFKRRHAVVWRHAVDHVDRPLGDAADGQFSSVCARAFDDVGFREPIRHLAAWRRRSAAAPNIYRCRAISCRASTWSLMPTRVHAVESGPVTFMPLVRLKTECPGPRLPVAKLHRTPISTASLPSMADCLRWPTLPRKCRF